MYLSGGTFDYGAQKERLEEILLRLENPNIWNNPDEAQKLGEERVRIEKIVNTFDRLRDSVDEYLELLQLLDEEEDSTVLDDIERGVNDISRQLEKLEFRRMFSGEADHENSFLDIQAGSGGTEAQDWAQMLLRMYIRWAESEGFETQIVEKSHGEVAGIKSATIRLRGDYAYGYLRTETGVHRLVRKSPFDSGNRRHTSFASVFAYPEIDESIEVEINPVDLRIDTYRASGAGGQHVNRMRLGMAD